ncbi:glycosyltransferase family 2 protein [Amphibacillus sediminis]|uniref:glycosyltransferase family 2 protein n=1 Tax=Amphibacillus sediminis TaxID=360185 RepID=UPI00082E0916|nr:glycosyltransferase family 2 protein [Amphibacillus sediminis]
MKSRQKSMVSVITPSFNAEATIENTINSVLNQTYENWEMIIIDDASTDDTVTIVEKYMNKDKRVKLIKHHRNKGAAHARNSGLEKAIGQFVAFLDSDDRWKPEKLEKQLSFMQSNSLAFSFTSYNQISTYKTGDKRIQKVNAPSVVTYHDLLKSNVIGCLTVMVNVEKTGPLQMVDIRARQDYALWLELTRKGYNAYGLEEPLADYYIRKNSLSSNKLKMAKLNWKIYRQVEKLSLFKTLWYFSFYLVKKVKKYVTMI